MVIQINNRKIGYNHKPLIIAEIGINHGGNIKKAFKMIDDAKKSGCECVKFQYHIPEKEMIKNNQVPGNSNRSIWEIINEIYLTNDQENQIKEYVEKKKMIYLSTPFSIEAADKLYEMGVKWFKVGSGECTNYPFIDYLTKFKLPIILSTGMNKFEDIKKSIKIIEKKKINYVLMQCTSMYPTPENSINLNVISTYMKKFKKAILGFSDHSIGNYAAISSVALGARLIEKHFTSSKSWKGEDIPVSMDPIGLKELIIASNSVFKSLGDSQKKVLKGEKITQKFAFSSVVSTKHIKSGETLSKKNIWVKRPGTGKISARDYFKIIGKKSIKEIKKNVFISPKMFK